MLFRFLGFWVVRRAFRLLTADDGRPLATRVKGEAKRIILGAAVTLGVLFAAAIVLVAVLVQQLT